MKFYVLLVVLNSVFVLTFGAYDSEESSEEYYDDDKGEYGDYFEGDMLLTEEQYKDIEAAKTPDDDTEDNAPKNGLRDTSRRWPNNTVIYKLPGNNVFNKEQLEMIEEALQTISAKSCIKFRKKQSTDKYAVNFQNRKQGCFSSVGYNGGRKGKVPPHKLNLSKNCFVVGIIIHEMLHTLGFFHMQSTYDRDDYVKISFENIQKGYEYNFAKYTNSTVTDFGVPYDYGSVMHYPANAFSKNGKNTITPKKKGARIGQRRGLSRRDIIKLNRMYNCPTETPTTEKENIMDLDFLDPIMGP